MFHVYFVEFVEIILRYNYFFIFQLQMLGYDITWAAFNIIEVMSSSKFTFKVGMCILLNLNLIKE